jgi:F-type H+-transporting ATPase subunit gamma
MVAISKIKKLDQVIESREFSLYFALEMFSGVSALTLNAARQTVVVITSEKSCCGKLNSEVLSASKDALETFIEENKILKLISIGWKGRVSLVSKFKAALCKSISGVKISFLFSYVIYMCAVTTVFDTCALYFSKYYKIFEQVSAMYEFVSYDIFFDYVYMVRKASFYFDILLANCALNFKDMYVFNVCLLVLDALEENIYSELGCRAFSMEMAHKNATELININMLLYNKARQGAITTELLEIVAGAIYTV